MQKAIEIQGAGEIEVDFDTELRKLIKAGSLHKSEGEIVQKILMQENPGARQRTGRPPKPRTPRTVGHADEPRQDYGLKSFHYQSFNFSDYVKRIFIRRRPELRYRQMHGQ